MFARNSEQSAKQATHHKVRVPGSTFLLMGVGIAALVALLAGDLLRAQITRLMFAALSALLTTVALTLLLSRE